MPSRWINRQQSIAPDKPFFIYFATGATHSPLHAPQEWIDKFKGKFDQGWDKVREETLERQKELGVVPQNTVLTPRPEEIPAWDSLDGRSEAALRPAHGGLRRVPAAHRLPGRAAA